MLINQTDITLRPQQRKQDLAEDQDVAMKLQQCLCQRLRHKIPISSQEERSFRSSAMHANVSCIVALERSKDLHIGARQLPLDVLPLLRVQATADVEGQTLLYEGHQRSARCEADA